jgi:hypothetical protein
MAGWQSCKKYFGLIAGIFSHLFLPLLAQEAFFVSQINNKSLSYSIH